MKKTYLSNLDLMAIHKDGDAGAVSGGDLAVSDLSSKGGIKQPEQAQRINTPVNRRRVIRKKRFYSGALDL